MFDQAVLDNFNRADESPLSASSGGIWRHTNNRMARLLSNRLAAHTALNEFAEPRYEAAGPFTDTEAYVTLAVVNEWHIIACRLQSVSSPLGTVSGYLVQWAPSSLYVLKRVSNTQSTVAGPFTISLSAGDKLGIRAIGTTIQGWYYKAGAWTMAGSGTDATYSSGYLGVGLSNSASLATGRLDDFGGGAPVTAPTFIPQIVIS